MQNRKVLVVLLILFLLCCFNVTFAQENKGNIKEEKKNQSSTKAEKISITSLGLDRYKSIGLIGGCTSDEYDFIGSFRYYSPIFIRQNTICFLDYIHSVPLNKEPNSSAFSIDDVQFDLKLGFKRLVRNKWLFLGYYSHRSAIKVDQKGFANLDSLHFGLETGGFTMKNIETDINWNTSLGVILHNTEGFKGVNIKGELAIDLARIGRNANMGVDFKFDTIISGHHGYGEEEAKFRINFFSQNGNICSLYAAYLKSNHPYGLEGQGFHFGTSWEQGMPPKGLSSPLSQWMDINGLFFLGLCNGGNGAIYADLGADWEIGGNEEWKLKANVQGWGWILSQGGNNAFYTILGGATLFYQDRFGFGFSFNHRSNHLIHQSFTNPASSINFTDFVVYSRGWHLSNREYGFQFKKSFPAKINYFFSIGRVHSAQFVDTGTAALKYGIRIDFPEVGGNICPFLRYYGESVGFYQLNHFQCGVIASNNWLISGSLYQDEEAYGDDRFFVVGIGKVF